jgi:hypothetical protein
MRLQGVHSNLRHDACTNFTLLSAIERENRALAQVAKECIQPRTPLSLDDAQRLVQGYVEHYNNIHLNGAIGYITPKEYVGRTPSWRVSDWRFIS